MGGKPEGLWFDDITIQEKTIQGIIIRVNEEAADALYISDDIKIPETSKIKRCYRTDFVLIPKKEVKKKCIENKKLHLSKEDQTYEFFVYNERKHQIVPFKENDYLMDKDGYLTFDGKSYIQYDNDGNELWRF